MVNYGSNRRAWGCALSTGLLLVALSAGAAGFEEEERSPQNYLLEEMPEN